VTYDIVISVDNTDLTLMPGMTAASRIIVDQRDDAIRVPNQALRYIPKTIAGAVKSDQAQIWVLRDGEPTSIPVVAGLDDDNFTEIASGEVKPGDLVITAEQVATASKTAMPRFGR
jgi:HlyD family secretion protein